MLFSVVILLIAAVNIDGARFAKRPAKVEDIVKARVASNVTEAEISTDAPKVTELPEATKEAVKVEGKGDKKDTKADEGKFVCPEESGLFPDKEQCDKYYECKNGTAVEQLCVDGLVYNQDSKRFGKCDQPFNVDCDGRPKLQPPQPSSEFCPRRNGVFEHPDKTICDRFFNCDDGVHSEYPCANGLHFDKATGTCTWPNVVDRENCQDQKRKLVDGFVCPNDINKRNAMGQNIVNPYYPHPTDCQQFYVCVNGVEPRLLKCEDDYSVQRFVYNDKKMICTEPEEVPGCEDWFNKSEESSSD